MAQEVSPWPISFSSPVEAEMPRRGAGGHDHRAGLALARRGFHQETAVVTFFDRLDVLELDPGAEFLRLLLHPAHQFGPHHAFGKSREILHLGGGGELPARLGAGQHQRFEIGAGGVDGGGVSGTAGADDDHVFHDRRRLAPPSIPAADPKCQMKAASRESGNSPAA